MKLITVFSTGHATFKCAAGLFLGLCAVLFLNDAIALTNAMLERTSVMENDTIRLIVESDNPDQSAQIDLQSVTESFNVISTNSNQSFSMVNGVQSFKRQWFIELEPKRSGRLIVPSIAIGSESTQPLNVSVLSRSAKAIQSNGEEDVFIVLEATPENSYVQQQITLTVRLHLGVALAEATLSEPTHNDVTIRRLGKDRQYTKTINQREYLIVEREYALFPEKSGKLALDPLRFSGLAQDSTQNLMSSFFNQGTPISHRSRKLQLDIQPPNPEFQGGTWLPATALDLKDLSGQIPTVGISGAPIEVRAGEPINQQIRIRSLGLTAEQLPELRFPESPDFKIYADKPVLDTQLENGQLVGTQTQSIAIIPTKPGTFSLPAISIPWWDIKTDSQRFAKLNGGSFRVLELENSDDNITVSTSGEKQNSDDIESLPSPPLTMAPPSTDTPKAEQYWQIVSGILSIAWIGTLFLLIRKRKPRFADSDESNSITQLHSRAHEADIALKQVKRACSENLPQDARVSVLRWGAALLSVSGPLTLHDIVLGIRDDALEKEIGKLDAAMYSQVQRAWNGDELLAAITNYRHSSNGKADKGSEALPGLHPLGTS